MKRTCLTEGIYKCIHTIRRVGKNKGKSDVSKLIYFPSSSQSKRAIKENDSAIVNNDISSHFYLFVIKCQIELN